MSSNEPNNNYLQRPSLGNRDDRPSSDFLGQERNRISIEPTNYLQRPSLGSRDERPSSEFLGQERNRISIIAEDSDERTSGSSPELELEEKPSIPSSYSEDDDDEEDDDEKILPESLTEDWEEKMSRFSQANTLEEKRRRESERTVVGVALPDEKASRRISTASAASSVSQCSNCGHHRRASSVTLASRAMSPTNPNRKSSVQRHSSLRITPRVQPMSPTAAAASEQQQQQGQRALPFAVKRVASHAMSDVQTTRHVSGEGSAFSEPHSETASIISSIFAPPLRHLASHPSLNGSSLGSPRRGSILTPVAEQRHPGKAGARISRFTRPFEPDIDEDDGEDYLRQVRRLEALRAQQRISQVLAADVFADREDWVEGWPLAFIVMGICLVVFLISVDRTIITTAIPFITAEFQSTADIGWYGSAYLLTSCAFQPVFGKVFTLFSVKWSYIFAMFMFLGGSLICALAPSSAVLIIGRAVAGFGSAGILTGSFLVIATAVPMRFRAVYMAVVGLMFGLGATVSPLLGGVFTDLVTWRWCFYFNLPIVGATMAIFLLFFHPKRLPRPRKSFMDRLMELDSVGIILLLGAGVMLFLALEHTNQGEPWSSTRIIGLLSGAGATAVVFAAWQWWRQDGALIPPAIITQRTVAASCVAAFATYGALIIHSYFLPIWFQAIRGEDALSSGVDMIPYVATIAIFSLISSVFVSIVGYPVPPAVIGGVIGTAGSGILRLLTPNTPTTHWIGFEILVSAGFGMSIQQGFTAVQAVLPPDDISIGTAAVVASQSLGGAIFISVGNTLFQNHLLQASAKRIVPGVDIRQVLMAGATSFRTIVPANALPRMLIVYNDALRVAFTVAIPLAGVATIAACFMEWKSVKEKKAR
ncbi:major facilitator superfamily transporter [Colletotrichum karsti]|uniref:Major facilitator superfamily transporter n=1 Tax=Colletotrichum karsti TaxID=1095194 RepID=A0A9P6LL01_9PEZI|nr:major facilitator superfamily transporter [Colletotrichum karsti]KAF9876721.1 major facilitator superfamily transporter [Colletotrichum karsti]